MSDQPTPAEATETIVDIEAASEPRRLYVAAAFSLSMLDRDAQMGGDRRTPWPISKGQAQARIDDAADLDMEIISCIGHADVARIISGALEHDLPAQRIGVRLTGNDRLLVAQIVTTDGQPYRLPAGCTALPDDAAIEWWTI